MYPIGLMPFSPFDVVPSAAETESDRFVPMIALHETPLAYEIEMALPTATIDDIEVTARRSAVTVGCRHAIDHDDGSRFGAFVKTIDLGCPVDTGSVAVDLRKGVLRVQAKKLLVA